MNKLLAICYFVLSLYGCDVGGNTIVHRTQSNGTDTLYSKVVTHGGVARFDCVRSTSGQCHYSVFSRDCASASASTSSASRTPDKRCVSRPIERFAIANGDSRSIPGLQAFSVCVSAQGATAGADCGIPEPVAAR